jgi:ubiquitin carboxyl-terminal hydrolase 4/11/15
MVIHPDDPKRHSTSLLPRKNSGGLKICGACAAVGSTKRCGSCQMIWYCGASCQTSHWKYHKTICKSLGGVSRDSEEIDVSPERRGKMGLRNLGNTCFMNSAIQCLSHTEILTKHFLSNAFQKDLNTDNPLGTGGNLASEYDSLMKELWFGASSNTVPSGLKRAISRFAPQFSGFQQHDAQELLAYLLDGLHEDLNRVKKKPYIEAKESDGRPDHVVAEEAWNNHLLRNQSIFVDHIQGQFKSTVVCPKCDKVSITFDPFNCIQLELPMQNQRLMEVIVVCLPKKEENPRKHYPLRYALEVPKKGSVSSLKV